MRAERLLDQALLVAALSTEVLKGSDKVCMLRAPFCLSLRQSSSDCVPSSSYHPDLWDSRRCWRARRRWQPITYAVW